MKLLELLKGYGGKDICWYPSAGDDLENLSLWHRGYGNDANPKLFILTDAAYTIKNNLLNYPFQNGREIIVHSNQRQEFIMEDLTTFDINESGIRNYFIANLSEVTIEMALKNRILNEDEETMLDLQIIDRRDLLKDDNNYNPPAIGILIEMDRFNVFFIAVENRSFYNYCIANSIKIGCLMAQRSTDEWLTNGIDFDTLGICELMKGHQGEVPENIPSCFLKLSDFDWDTHYPGTGSFYQNENC